MAYLKLAREGGAYWSSDSSGSSLLAAAGSFLKRHKTCILAAVAVVGTAKIYSVLRMRRLRAEWNSVGPNVVVLHTFPPGKACPSPALAALKLETFFRLTNIKYITEHSVPFGAKGKSPWVTVNGVDIADSEIIVEALQKMFNKFPDAELPSHERAVGVAMRVMLEEYFYWGVMAWRYLEDRATTFFKVYKMPLVQWPTIKIFQHQLKKVVYYQGIGRHSNEEIHSFMKKNLEAVSLYLGSKPFLLGETPSVADCAVFGALCQVLYNASGGPYDKYIREDLPNLVQYVERVKDRFWPDWEDCLAKES